MFSLVLLAIRIPEFAALSVLALLQGLTEFLPISSSGHLVLAQAAMGFEEPALTIDVALHLGTLVAVVLVYRRDLFEILREVLGGDLRQVLLLVVGTLPAGIVGVLFKDQLERVFHSPRYAACGLLVTAVVLLAGEAARRRRVREGAAGVEESASGGAGRLGFGLALLIGTAQAFAIWPGISRSGSTIAAGMLCGLDPRAAARFSFLLSIPAILGAAVLNLPDAVAEGVGGGWQELLWAGLFAGLVGWGALRALLAFLGRGAFAWFAIYCVALGTGTLIFT